MNEIPKALFICSQMPSKSACQAGHKTAFHYLSELSKTNLVDLIVVCKSIDLPLERDAYVSLGKITSSISIISVSIYERLIGMVLGVFLGLSPRFSTRISIKLCSILAKMRGKSEYQIVWLEFSQSFWAALFLRETNEIIMSAHDVQTQVVSRKSRVEAMFFLGWTYLSELKLFKVATTIRVQSLKDAEFISEVLRPGCHIEVSRPVLSEFIYSIKRVTAKIEPYSMLFWGAMSRQENSSAIINFVKNYFSALKAEYPALKLYIVGAGPTQEIYALKKKWQDSIIITGFVEDPSEYFEKCSLGIAPLITGAGIKVKVLEMLEAKIPVLSTSVGSEGIPKNDLLHTAPIELFKQELKLLWG